MPALPAAPRVSGLTAKGAVNAYGSRVGTHQVTVVGEVPVMTIRLIVARLFRCAHSGGN